MFKYLKRQWNYFVAKISGRAEANADPKVQLEQDLLTEVRSAYAVHEF